MGRSEWLKDRIPSIAEEDSEDESRYFGAAIVKLGDGAASDRCVLRGRTKVRRVHDSAISHATPAIDVALDVEEILAKIVAVDERLPVCCHRSFRAEEGLRISVWREGSGGIVTSTGKTSPCRVWRVPYYLD
ncbi:hypothetical protein M413DRAFT_265311 [Hebeloma cylindrosporum]|uniref:Uncharacterized protein n=1 Tax=Hebeloma cylindrosporum TaxID=76867 RepID=A0A0C2YAN7_HEBCY|nr:hypothetical protein M413DRAFT_265311 [Hebeloma cylindrosporum h7]